jgi:hypothetical protein
MRSTVLSLLFLALLAIAHVAAYDASFEEDIAILDLSEAAQDYGASFDLMAVSSSASSVAADVYQVYEVSCGVVNATVATCPAGNLSKKVFNFKKAGLAVTSLPKLAAGTVVTFQAGQDMFTSSNGQTLGGFIFCEDKGAKSCGVTNNSVSQFNIAKTTSGVAQSQPLVTINSAFKVTVPSAGSFCYGDKLSPFMGFCDTASAFSSAVVSVASVAAVVFAAFIVAL